MNKSVVKNIELKQKMSLSEILMHLSECFSEDYKHPKFIEKKDMTIFKAKSRSSFFFPSYITTIARIDVLTKDTTLKIGMNAMSNLNMLFYIDIALSLLFPPLFIIFILRYLHSRNAFDRALESSMDRLEAKLSSV